MKKILFLFTFCLLVEVSWAQTIYTADNNPGAIGGVNVFTGSTALQDAIDPAINTTLVAGDTIHVTRSSVNYGDITITLPLKIIGIGLDPDTDGSTRSNLATVNIEDPLASGTRLSGLWISTILNLGGTAGILSNLLIENSRIKRIQHTLNTTHLTNLIIRNNVIGYNLGTSTTEETIDLLPTAHSNVIIANNVLHGTGNNTQGLITASNGTFVENNLFLGSDGNDNAFENFTDNSVKNNIFIRKNVTAALGNSGNRFENNLSFGNANTSFPSTDGNEDIGNLIGDPLFVNVLFVNSIDFAQFDPTLEATSPAKGAGTDLTDIGLTGGPAPFSREGTLIPTIQSLTLPSLILKGDVLPVQIKAKGN